MTNANVPQMLHQKSILTRDLLLRPLNPDDAQSYFALCSDKDVMRGWGTKPHTNIGETKALLESITAQTKTGDLIRWGITAAKAPETILGDVGFWRFVKVRQRGELGAKLSKGFWNNGWMTQALSAVIEYGFQELGLNSVEGNIAPDNFGSLRLVEKIGFQKVGVIPQHSYDPLTQQYTDTVLYTLSKAQWRGFSCEII